MEQYYEMISEKIKEREKETIEFLQKLIQTPSLSGKEKEVANIIFQKLIDLEYDRVERDKAGNVFGIIEGEGEGKKIMYNCHMDHVPPGDMQDPYSGEVMDGSEFGIEGKVVFGRSACDMSGQIAATLYGAGILKELNIRPSGDLIVTFSVMEERGTSLGSRVLIEEDHLQPDVVIVGEATGLKLSVGHRGSVHPHVEVLGKSAHSSMPERGINALYKALDVINRIRSMTTHIPSHPWLGKVTLSVNTMNVEPSVVNVVPFKCSFDLDVRTTIDYTPQEIISDIRKAIEALKKEDTSLEAIVSIPQMEEESYTSYRKTFQRGLSPFYVDPTQEFVVKAKEAIEKIMNHPVEIITWHFATDAGFFSTIANIPTFGFGPGDEAYAHTSKEHIPIKDLIESEKVYAMLPLLYDINGDDKNGRS
jgi:putative selenium metabolism hydrolase